MFHMSAKLSLRGSSLDFDREETFGSYQYKPVHSQFQIKYKTNLFYILDIPELYFST